MKYYISILFCVVFGTSIFASSSISLFNSNSSTITVGTNPQGLAITPNGQYLYVANIGSNTVSVINTATDIVIKIITGFDKPSSVTINPAGTKAYVTNSHFGGVNTVSVIDINPLHVAIFNTIIATIAGFNGPFAMTITSDGKFGYVTNYGNPANVFQAGTTVNYVNLTTNLISGAAITVGKYPAAIAITPDDNFVYVANYVSGLSGSGTISVIDSHVAHSLFNTVIKTITGFFGPSGIAITPDGTLAYVTNHGNNFSANPLLWGSTVSVVDLDVANTTFNTIVDTITVGLQPTGITINPSGNYAFVTLYANGTVGNLVTIQLSDNIVLPPSFTLGKGPFGVVAAPNGLSVYVTNYNDKDISVLSCADTFAVFIFNLTSNIFLYISNMFTNTLLQTIGYLISNATPTSTQYSVYSTFAQLLQTPGCTGINFLNFPNCGNMPVNVRVFVNGGSDTTNFYFDLPYTSLMSSVAGVFGPVTLDIDFVAATAQIVAGQSPTAQLFTTTGNSTVTGVVYTLSTNVVYSDAA